jgi:hypothetical protein
MADATQAVDATDTTQAVDAVKTFPAEYVAELRQEAASYRTKLKEFEEKQRQTEEQRLAQQQEWQKLAEQRAQEVEQLRPYQERYEAMINNLRANNQKRLEAVPETMKTLIPPIDDPATLASWLDTNWQLLTAKPLAPSLNGGAGQSQPRSTSVTLTDAELQMAAKMGISAEDYAAAKVKR